MEKGVPNGYENSLADSKQMPSGSFSRPSSLKFSSSSEIDAQAKVSNRNSGSYGGLSAAEKSRLLHHSEVPYSPSDRLHLDPKVALKKKLQAQSSREIVSVENLHVNSTDTVVGPALVPNTYVAHGLGGMSHDSSSSIDTVVEVLSPNEKARRVKEGKIPFSPNDHLTPHTAMKMQYQKASSVDYSNNCLLIEEADEK